jgi:branched-chain amino acid transport system substrate-binding protein
VLGKEVKLASPTPGQAERRGAGAAALHHREQGVMMTGRTSSSASRSRSTSSPAREGALRRGISGSNDTTGKDCVRYGFRQCFYGQTAAAAIGPVLVKASARTRRSRIMTPDYTYGHTVTKSMQDNYLTKERRLDHQVTNQVSPLGAPDFSLSAQHRQLRRRRLINVNWGHDAVLSIQQAKQFGVLDKMKLVCPTRSRSWPRNRRR